MTEHAPDCECHRCYPDEGPESCGHGECESCDVVEDLFDHEFGNFCAKCFDVNLAMDCKVRSEDRATRRAEQGYYDG